MRNMKEESKEDTVRQITMNVKVSLVIKSSTTNN